MYLVLRLSRREKAITAPKTPGTKRTRHIA
jgi:hypothetical protein